MPLENPVASMIVLFGLRPMSDRLLSMITSSLYVPFATRIVSLAEAAATAAPIEEKQPDEPARFTHKVAASACLHIGFPNVIDNAISAPSNWTFRFRPPGRGCLISLLCAGCPFLVRNRSSPR